MSNNVDYSSAWHDYGRRRRWFWGVYLGGFFGIAGLGLLFSNSPAGDLVFAVLAPVWMIGFVVTTFRCQFFGCPRCHQRFFGTWLYNNPFARRCVHCGLLKWAEEDSPIEHLQIMNATHEHTQPTGTSERQQTSGNLMEWGSNLPAVLFNTGFAILAIVTLCGIVFITKPKQVMHDIRPEMWLPLLVVVAPAQIYAQLLSWATIFAGKAPTGPAIAVRQMKIPGPLKPAVALLWLCNFCIGFGVVVSLSKPHPGNPAPPLAAVVIVTIIAFWLAFAANVYLLLAVRTLTLNEYVLHRVWRFRLWIDLTMVIFATIYYRLWA